jgi:hypothetical protein
MSDEMYAALFTRIREKCQQQHWFGSDYENPFKEQEWVGGVARATRRWYESRGKQYAIERDADLPPLPVYTDFEFPPATEEQLRATEGVLGFPLPHLLRALYAQLANAGFGPRYGIMGALGGYADNFGTIVDAALMRRKGYRPVDLAECEKQAYAIPTKELPFTLVSNMEIEPPDGTWPESLLDFCHHGCGDLSSIDIRTGRIFVGGNPLLWYEATSLEEWFERWLNGEMNV